MDAGRGAGQRDLGRLESGVGDLQRIEVLSSALVRATDAVTAKALANDINNDQRLNMNAVSEEEYYSAQTASAAPIEYIGIFVAIIMAVGSAFAAMNTMYAAVAAFARNRHAARFRIFQGQHPVQLLSGIRAALGTRRRTGVPAGASLEWHHHGNRQLQFFGDGVQFPCVAVNHDGRDRVCRDSGSCRRTVSGEQRGAKRNSYGVAGGLTRPSFFT